MPPLDALDHTFFSAMQGGSFEVLTPQGPLTLTLEAVTLLGNRRPDALRDPFALAFRGASGVRLPQGIYEIRLHDGQTLELFIVQNADSPKGSEFEAIFN
ncbi:MAG: hypothetical protein QM755_20680 [Luteolibacter sp.]